MQPGERGRKLDYDRDNETAGERRSKSLKRIGTASPYRNKDGSIDRRRVHPGNRRHDLEESDEEENMGGRRS